MASALAGMLFFAFYFPNFFLASRYQDMTKSEKIGACFLFNMAMSFGAKVFSLSEGTGMKIFPFHHFHISFFHHLQFYLTFLSFYLRLSFLSFFPPCVAISDWTTLSLILSYIYALFPNLFSVLVMNSIWFPGSSISSWFIYLCFFFFFSISTQRVIDFFSGYCFR